MISPEILRRFPFFAGLSNEQIVAMTKVSSELTVETDYYFFREGDYLDKLNLVLEGAVAMVIEVPEPGVEHKLSEQLTGILQTKDIVISAVGPGEVFGWSALVEPHKAAVSGKATTPCRIVAFDCRKLLQIFEGDCRFGYLMLQKIAEVIGDRLRAMRVESLAQLAG